MLLLWLLLQPWRFRQHFSLESQYICTRICEVTSEEAIMYWLINKYFLWRNSPYWANTFSLINYLLFYFTSPCHNMVCIWCTSKEHHILVRDFQIITLRPCLLKWTEPVKRCHAMENMYMMWFTDCRKQRDVIREPDWQNSCSHQVGSNGRNFQNFYPYRSLSTEK